MIIKNLTSETQSVKAISLRGDREFTFYVIPHGCKEILDMYIPNMEKLKGIFEVVTANNVEANNVEAKEPQKEDNSGEDKKEENLEDKNDSQNEDTEDNDENKEPSQNEDNDGEGSDDKEPQKSEGKFICDICGQEFASTRGLSSHKNRAHLEEK